MTMSVYDGSTLMHLPYFSPPFCLNVFCCHSSQTQSSRITFSSLLFHCVLSFRQSQYGLWLLHRSERSAHQSFAIPQDYPKVLCCVKRMLTSSLKLCCPWRELWTSYFKIWCIKAFVHTQCIEASTSKLIIHGYLLKKKKKTFVPVLLPVCNVARYTVIMKQTFKPILPPKVHAYRRDTQKIEQGPWPKWQENTSSFSLEATE